MDDGLLGGAAETVQAHGKFFQSGGRKLYVRGVTYGTFAADAKGYEFPARRTVEDDFDRMAECGVNAVRTYSVPPAWLLDVAWRRGLRVMIGVPAERWIGDLIDRGVASSAREVVRESVGAGAGHPGILAYSIGNEIPAPLVRWLGARRVERFLWDLYRTAKDEDPAALVTYANYPSTEYLRLEFLDFLCFNVFLESRGPFEAYLRRLQNICGDRPLVLGEMGLDSRRHGEEGQARGVDWQVRAAFAAGCAGAFVYAWTDEWHTAAGEVHDWDFGLVRRDRQPKPALHAARSAFAGLPLPRTLRPRISVVVCSYNGGRLIAACLDGISALDYPDFETIVVDDGSTDETAAIARRYPVRVISTGQQGLSSARNTGLAAATGEIVAYIDDDAHPDPHWLAYLAEAFSTTDHAGIGGPNIPPPGDGLVAECVARAPGNPVHVLLTDEEAEHIPGCNMAFRRSCLEAVGGFDPRFRSAGDDVDICWRLREQGWTLGFSPGAMVWHHRRSTIRAYWKQQVGYGRAEALLEAKWPQRFNEPGHAHWAGRLYAGPAAPASIGRRGIYHGVWGMAPFQSLYRQPAGLLIGLPLMPEWYLLVGALLAVGLLGILWPPLLVAAPLAGLAIASSLLVAVWSGSRSTIDGEAGGSPVARPARWVVTTVLYLLQPAARLRGRLQLGLSPWRRTGDRVAGERAFPRRRDERFWSERWQPHEAWVGAIREALTEMGATVVDGGPFDRFDIEVRGGTLGAVRLILAVEEHGAGRQLVRIRSWPHWPRWGIALVAPPLMLCAAAVTASAWVPAGVFAAVVVALMLASARQWAATTAAVTRAIDERIGGAATVVPLAREAA